MMKSNNVCNVDFSFFQSHNKIFKTEKTLQDKDGLMWFYPCFKKGVLILKILILSNLTSYTYNFRYEIIRSMKEAGHEITVACHNDDEKKSSELEALGCRMEEVSFNGKGTNVSEELRLLHTYSKLIRTESPDIIFTFTIKMNLYGGIAAKRARVPFVPMITGLGELEKKGKLRILLLCMHRYVMPEAKCVVFQNEDNRVFFRDNCIGFKKSVVVPGSGINLEKFRPAPYPEGGKTVLSFIGRLTKAKGIDNFLDVAEDMTSDETEFHAAGTADEEYRERLNRLCKEKKLVYEGALSDVRPLLEKTSCLVLPTFHPEGISNVILEACAMARPVICTSRTGCKEIVRDNINGFYCEAKDSENLKSVVRRFCELNTETRSEMGLAGRKIVEENFDRGIVVDSYMDMLKK